MPESFDRSNSEVGQDGNFRVCDLQPGEYRITAEQSASQDQPPAAVGYADFTVTDRDVKGIRLDLERPVLIKGVVEIENPPMVGLPSSTMGLMLTRPGQSSAEKRLVSAPFPGEFTLNLFPNADYAATISEARAGLYLKEATYAGASILSAPVRPSNDPKALFRIVFARDGGVIRVTVADREGKPVPDANVVIVPDIGLPDAELARRMMFAATNQFGRYTTAMLPPGKYWLISTTHENSTNVDSVTLLLRNRSKGEGVILDSGAAPEVRLSPLDLTIR